MRLRGFEIAKGYEDKDIHLPVRKTKNSAGYDVEAASDIVIEPYKNGMKPTLIPTGLKAYCQDDEYYILVNRSSGPKKGLVMANSIGIIDADYYNSDNEGHIWIKIQNEGDKDYSVKKGQAMIQGIFMKYLTVDDEEEIKTLRNGGIGSTTNN